MKKSLLPAYQAYIKECEIDSRTLPMIVHHYVSIGEQAAASLTDEKIESVYQKCVKEQAETETKGRITIITPEFQKYILVACQKLYRLPNEVKYAIIKENI